ncbi:non-specific lipid-transfer protein 1-like [Phalaenopsis equestris]|uniref:non-specific lipid-transfer protein 1-like n=1 Tax=Phalaenopsis equestris TaxID=78828 RepID=UPI0009E552F1|nr:non-specific lipid-transfer protein 1-like [Phalaenopsis equestris]
MSALVAVMVLVVVAAVTLPTGEEQLTCLEVVGGYFTACLNYLNSGGLFPAECCSGLRSLAETAQAALDRSTACNCLKMLVQGAAEEVLRRAGLLPKTCQISDFPFVISPTTDCST